MKSSIWPQIVLIVIAVFAVFGQCMTFEFIRWDDEPLIIENPYVNQPSVRQMAAAWRAASCQALYPADL